MGDVFGLGDLCSRAVTTSDPELSLDLLPKFLCAWHSSAAAITLWNTGLSRRAAEALATTIVEVVGKTVFDFVPARIAAKFHAEDLHVLRSEAVVQSVDQIGYCAGNSIWMSVTKMPPAR